MSPRIVDARYIGGHTLHVRFADGAEGDVDLAGELDGGVFEPLKDVEVFRQVRVHPELRTIVWPNGADFAPEFIYSLVRVST